MSQFDVFSSDAQSRMTSVYRRAVRELNLTFAPTGDREQLARVILTVGRNISDPHQLLDRVIRHYQRQRSQSHRPGETITRSWQPHCK
jgi:hypothetical protein